MQEHTILKYYRSIFSGLLESAFGHSGISSNLEGSKEQE